MLPLLVLQGMLLRNTQTLERAKVLSPVFAIVSIMASGTRAVVGYEMKTFMRPYHNHTRLANHGCSIDAKARTGYTHLSGSGNDSNSACEHGGIVFALCFMVPGGLLPRAANSEWNGAKGSRLRDVVGVVGCCSQACTCAGKGSQPFASVRARALLGGVGVDEKK